MNRGVEIDPVVADAADALIETQVRAGLVTRMAVLYDLLTHGPVVVKAAAIHEVEVAPPLDCSCGRKAAIRPGRPRLRPARTSAASDLVRRGEGRTLVAEAAVDLSGSTSASTTA